MLKYLILYALIAHSGTGAGTWARPVQQQQQHGGDLASHVVIVTPQAQVHLEPATKFGPFIHHLSPFARIAAPHEETIVYVPASAAAPIIPIDALTQHVVGRASFVEPGPQAKQQQGSNQIAQIQQAFEQGQAAAAAAGAAAQEGFGQISEQFAEAAASLSPASFFPSPSAAAAATNKDEKKFSEKLQTPANTQELIAAPTGTARHFYTIAAQPILPHIVDIVHAAPVLVSHPAAVSVLRARSIEDASQIPIVAVPLSEASKPEALPLQENLKQGLKEGTAAAAAAANDGNAEREKAASGSASSGSNDFGRFLEANAFRKNEGKGEQQQQQQLDEHFKRDSLQSEQKDQAASTASEPAKPTESQAQEFSQPQLKSISGAAVVGSVGSSGNVVEVAAAGAAAAASQAVHSVVGDDGKIVPPSKVV